MTNVEDAGYLRSRCTVMEKKIGKKARNHAEDGSGETRQW